MKNKKAFTLIELLVVVLIIGILAAIAVPQYQKAVEKSRMTEAVMFVREIAEAHKIYYLTTGNYLAHDEINKLDITIPGGENSEKRIYTEYFVYSPNACTNTCSSEAPYIAFATRIKDKNDLLTSNRPYAIFITKEDPQKIQCAFYSAYASETQKYLCKQLNEKNYL